MSAPDMAKVERLVADCDHVWSFGKEARTALLDAVRAIVAERDALIADNERLMQIVSQEVSAAPQPVGDPCRVAQPTGWRCTRTGGHEGPCAAVEDRA